MIIIKVIMHDKTNDYIHFMMIAILSMTMLMQERVGKTYLYVMSKAGGLTADLLS